MALRIGQVLEGQNATYRLLETLKAATVFKAQILPCSHIKPGFAVVKTELSPEKICLKRERNNYKLPAIASCQYIRTLLDHTIPHDDDALEENKPTATEHPCLVLEWMEHDLRTVPSDAFRENSSLPKLIAKSVLSALDLLHNQYSAVHTDINPNNIFLSGIKEQSPVVKLGDLGNMVMEGYDKIRVQSLPTRAPEVWRGLGCWHSSDVWSVGVTLAQWLSPSIIFGAKDKIVQELAEAWCIAKIRRLVGPLDPPINPDYEEEFLVAEHLDTTTFTHPDTKLETCFIKVGTLRQELEQLPGPKVAPDLIDFIELVVDHTKRPTALEALQHPYLQSLS